MKVDPQKEHDWLHKLIGEWTYEANCVMGPDQPPAKSTGSETVRSLGGLWVMCEGQGEMPDGDLATTMMTLGYDPQEKRFVGTFIASMMTHLWSYDGALDGNVLTLNADGPNFAVEGQMAKYRDVIEIRGDDHRTLTSYMLGDDQKWQQIMSANYRRRK
jgi:hypothetical protein